MFKKGEYVVHGRSGVCTVDSTTKEVPGAKAGQLYYILVPVKTPQSKIFFPLDSDRIVLRALKTEEEAKAALKEMKEVEIAEFSSDRERENEFKQDIASCEHKRLARVIKTLTVRNQEREKEGKRSTFVDARLLNEAKELINQEFSIALGIEMCDIESYIMEQIF